MIATLIPLFRADMTVGSYSVRAQKDNHLLDGSLEGYGRYDGAGNVSELDVVNSMGVEALAGNRTVFVPVNKISIFSDIASMCKVPVSQIILLMDNTIPPTEQYVNRIKELRESGFSFGIKKLAMGDFLSYNEILKVCDYVFLNRENKDIEKSRQLLSIKYRKLKLCAVNINTPEEKEELDKHGTYDLYEGKFFRIPVVDADSDINPLKFNYVKLFNTVNAPDFDLSDAADVIGEDTALVISLLEMVNKMTVNSGIKSVRHATAMLGQKELRRWIDTALAKELCADKPSEITRMSMIRAMFAENLAPEFEIANLSQELFLMGMFSLIDVMLNKPMEEALKILNVNKNINNALINKSGPLYPVLEFAAAYENADWAEVSRIMVLRNLDIDRIYKAYLDALKWYRDLIRKIDYPIEFELDTAEV